MKLLEAKIAELRIQSAVLRPLVLGAARTVLGILLKHESEININSVQNLALIINIHFKSNVMGLGGRKSSRRAFKRGDNTTSNGSPRMSLLLRLLPRPAKVRRGSDPRP